jgi:hypothetical protein
MEEYNQEELEKIFNNLRATAVFVALLKHNGKMFLPGDMFKELLNEQIWPNDFIYKNGSAMCITYDKDKNEFGFELMYEDDGYVPNNALGFQCTRGNLEVGHIDYNDPRIKNNG